MHRYASNGDRSRREAQRRIGAWRRRRRGAAGAPRWRSAIVARRPARGHRGVPGGGRPPEKAAKSAIFRRHSGTALYQRTMENLKTICDPAPGRSVREFCREQAGAGAGVPRMRRRLPSNGPAAPVAAPPVIVQDCRASRVGSQRNSQARRAPRLLRRRGRGRRGRERARACRTAGRARRFSSEHVDPRLAEEAEVAALDAALDAPARRAPARRSRARATRGTCQSAASGDRCGIEPAGRGGDQLAGHRAAARRGSPCAGARRRPRRGRAASATWGPGSSRRRGRGVVAVARRGGARLEVGRVGEPWPISSEPTTWPVLVA